MVMNVFLHWLEVFLCVPVRIGCFQITPNSVKIGLSFCHYYKCFPFSAIRFLHIHMCFRVCTWTVSSVVSAFMVLFACFLVKSQVSLKGMRLIPSYVTDLHIKHQVWKIILTNCEDPNQNALKWSNFFFCICGFLFYYDVIDKGE